VVPIKRARCEEISNRDTNPTSGPGMPAGRSGATRGPSGGFPRRAPLPSGSQLRHRRRKNLVPIEGRTSAGCEGSEACLHTVRMLDSELLKRGPRPRYTGDGEKLEFGGDQSFTATPFDRNRESPRALAKATTRPPGVPHPTQTGSRQKAPA
jgi:hypothetical protein